MSAMVKVKYFASLRERLGKSEECLEFKSEQTVAELWRQVSGGLSMKNVLMTVNLEYAQPDKQLQDGDEIAFFPPVTGG